MHSKRGESCNSEYTGTKISGEIMGLIRSIRAVVVVLTVIVLMLRPAISQEDVTISAVLENQDEATSKIAIPEPDTVGNAALSPGDSAASSNMFFGRLTEEQERDIVNRAFPLLAAKWPFNKVFVCWEDTAEEYFDQRALVRAGVQETWEASSGLQFLGWGQCTEKSGGIRIAVRDTGPHVAFLGKFLDGLEGGMVLNFEYENWGTGCQERLNYCNRVIAIHEFGHAIGFAHEQNRPDTPGECNSAQGTDGDDITLTPWDEHSVMNYCNPVYSNDGVLSEFDILAVQYIYGVG